MTAMHLEELQDEADEVCGLASAAAGAPQAVDLHRFVHQALRCQAKAVLLPVHGVIDFHPQDLLHQVLHDGTTISFHFWLMQF